MCEESASIPLIPRIRTSRQAGPQGEGRPGKAYCGAWRAGGDPGDAAAARRAGAEQPQE